MVWCLLTAILAGMPYGVYSFGPMVPGQVSAGVLSIVITLFVMWAILAPAARARFPRASRLFVRCVGGLGAVSAVALLVVEAYAYVRGSDVIFTDAQIALNDAISLVEFVAAIVVSLAWAMLSADSIDAAPCDPIHVVGAFATGAMWPTIGILTSSLLGKAWTGTTFLLCLLTSCVAYIAALRLRRRWAPDLTAALLAGHLSFIGVRGFIWEYRTDWFVGGLPADFFYVLFLLLVAVAAVTSLLVLRARTRVVAEKNAAADSSDDDTTVCQQASDANALALRLKVSSSNALTNREASVLARSALGRTAQSIADELGLATATVTTYRGRGYEKLGVKGLKGLKKYVDELDSSSPEAKAASVEFDANSEASSTPLATRRPSRVRLAAFAGLLVLTQAQCSSDFLLDGHWYHRGTMYLMWSGIIVLSWLYITREVMHLYGHVDCHENPLPFSRAFLDVSSLVYVLVVALGIHCGWWGFLLYRLGSLALLILGPLAAGWDLRTEEAGGSRVSRLLLAYSSGFMRLVLRTPLLVLLAAAVQCLALFVDPKIVGLTTSLVFALMPIELLFWSVLLWHRIRASKGEAVRPTDSEAERVVHYLRGKGMDELRARIIFDLVCGHSVREVCERRSVALETVRSYRTRTYHDLGVHSLDELRNLLAKETKTTRLGKVHPEN